RRAMRTTLTVPATVTVDGETIEARLCDISEGGAMIEVERPFAEGDRVTLRSGHVEVEARIARQEQGVCGLVFETPLGEADIARQLLWSCISAHRARNS